MRGALKTLWKFKRSLLGWALAGLLLSGTLAFFRPAKYMATTTLLPPAPIQSVSAAVFSDAQALAGMTGKSSKMLRRAAVGQRLQMGVQRELVIGILHSENLAERLIARFRLADHFKGNSPSRSALILRLRAATRITDGKDGLIRIEVRDKNPEMAMRLANGYVEEYARLTQSLAVGEAAIRMAFFEKQMLRAKSQLTQSEEALKAFQALHRLSDLDSQTGMLLKLSQEIRNRIAAKEVELHVAKAVATPASPDVVRAQAELMALQGQLNQIRGQQQGRAGLRRMGIEQLPGLALEHTHARRDVEDALANYLMLSRQYEIAKMDAAQGLSAVKVLDKAVVPGEPFKPRRWINLMMVTSLFVLIAVIRAFIKESIERSRSDPANAARWAMFDRYRSWRRPA